MAPTSCDVVCKRFLALYQTYPCCQGFSQRVLYRVWRELARFDRVLARESQRSRRTMTTTIAAAARTPITYLFAESHDSGLSSPALKANSEEGLCAGRVDDCSDIPETGDSEGDDSEDTDSKAVCPPKVRVDSSGMTCFAADSRRCTACDDEMLVDVAETGSKAADR